jgi:hypothetical protein
MHLMFGIALVGLMACTEAPEPAATMAEAAQEEVPSIDWILTNGKILTVNEEFTIVQAIAVDDGKIVATGNNAEISDLAGPNTKQTDLAGQTVVPGLIDNHMHFVRASKQWYREVRLDSVKTRAEALALLAERASELPEGEWVVVNGGWIFAQFQDNQDVFTAAELDAAVPNTPVYIQEAYARAFLNSEALSAAGITRDTPFQGVGGIQKDANGNLTGELVGGAAMSLAAAHIPAVSDAVWEMSLLATVQSMHEMGLTTVYDVGGNSVTPEFYNSVRLISERGDLSLRVFYSLNGQNSDDSSAEDIIAAMQNNTPDTESLRFAQFGYGEQIYQPMRAGPVRPGASPWVLSDQDKEDYRRILIAAIDNGWQTNEHSHVEAKIQALLDVLEEINTTRPVSDLRMTIAHANGISDASIARARDLGLVFAIHGTSRNTTPETALLNGEAGLRIPPIRTIEQMDAIWGLGSDSTAVASPNPFHSIGWAVSGRSASGDITFGETVSRESALTAHTRSNAYLLFREADLGSLELGKQADFVILNRDYMTVAVEEIENLYSVMTVVEGEIVYQSN